jgi:hypothetical protein
MKTTNARFIGVIFLMAIIIFTSSCGSNVLSGRTFYLLDEEMNYTTLYSFIKEMRLKFINDDKVEIKMTLYADPTGYQIIDEDNKSELGETRIFSYTCEKGMFEIPSLNLIEKIEVLDDYDIALNGGDEYLYHTSTVDLLGTDGVYKRLSQGVLAKSAGYSTV